MKKMMLYVTTRGRIDHQYTLGNLPKCWLEKTVVVCPRNEEAEIGTKFPSLYSIKTPTVKDLNEKRAWIFNNTMFDKIALLDDDLMFHVRRRVFSTLKGFPENSKSKWADILRRYPKAASMKIASPTDVDVMLSRVENVLQTYAHAGFNSRFMSHTVGSEYVKNKRAVRFMAFDVPTVRKHCVLGRTTWLYSDYDYVLQLFEAGYENALYCWGTETEKRGWNASGGVSRYRTAKTSVSAAKQLKSFHPDTIRIVIPDKFTDDSHFGVEVRCQWKKAIKEGLERRGTKTGRIIEK